jgi:hypothetical protein
MRRDASERHSSPLTRNRAAICNDTKTGGCCVRLKRAAPPVRRVRGSRDRCQASPETPTSGITRDSALLARPRRTSATCGNDAATMSTTMSTTRTVSTFLRIQGRLASLAAGARLRGLANARLLAGATTATTTTRTTGEHISASAARTRSLPRLPPGSSDRRRSNRVFALCRWREDRQRSARLSSPCRGQSPGSISAWASSRKSSRRRV